MVSSEDITDEVIGRIVKVMKLAKDNTKISVHPIPEEERDGYADRFIARIIAANMITRGAGPTFDNPLIREYCFTGKIPKECDEK